MVPLKNNGLKDQELLRVTLSRNHSLQLFCNLFDNPFSNGVGRHTTSMKREGV
jgi:hypothetical protein